MSEFDPKTLEGHTPKMDEIDIKKKPKSKKKKNKSYGKDDVLYAFPTRSRCPICSTANTEQTTTRGNKQYRDCKSLPCGYKYCVTGDKV